MNSVLEVFVRALAELEGKTVMTVYGEDGLGKVIPLNEFILDSISLTPTSSGELRATATGTGFKGERFEFDTVDGEQIKKLQEFFEEQIDNEG